MNTTNKLIIGQFFNLSDRISWRFIVQQASVPVLMLELSGFRPRSPLVSTITPAPVCSSPDCHVSPTKIDFIPGVVRRDDSPLNADRSDAAETQNSAPLHHSEDDPDISFLLSSPAPSANTDSGVYTSTPKIEQVLSQSSTSTRYSSKRPFEDISSDDSVDDLLALYNLTDNSLLCKENLPANRALAGPSTSLMRPTTTSTTTSRYSYAAISPTETPYLTGIRLRTDGIDSAPFNPPPPGPSIENTRTYRRNWIMPPRDHGFLFPVSVYRNGPLDFFTPGWLSDPRFSEFVPRLQTGTAYICRRQNSPNGPGQRSYYVVLANLRARSFIKHINLLDRDQFAVFGSLRKVSNQKRNDEDSQGYKSLYNRFKDANRDNNWIPLTNDPVNEILCLSVDMPQDDHLTALRIIQRNIQENKRQT